MLEHATILGLLPLVAFVLATLACAVFRSRLGVGDDAREAAIVGSIACGAWTAAGSELLSLSRWLAPEPVAVWWLLPSIVLFVVVVRNRARLRGWLRVFPQMPRAQLFLGGLCCAALAVAALQGLLAPPNNSDAITYHLPRQVYWMEHRSAEHYAANDSRELIMPPLSEFFGVHLMLLSGGDRWANLVQWFALLLSMVAASLVARDLAGSGLAQCFAAFIVAANPIAFLQASSPKNDVLLGLWGIAAAWLILRVWRVARIAAPLVLLTGSALALLFLTKSTAFALGVPLGVALGGVLFVRLGARALVPLALVGATVVALNAGHLVRNQRAFGTPLGPRTRAEGGFPVVNEIVSGRALLSNLVRNAALHVGTPSDGWNARLTKEIERLHASLGADAHDARTTTPPGTRFAVRGDFLDEDSAPAPVHLLLVMVVPAVLFLKRKPPPDARFWVCLLLSYASFVLFCAVLKWQPWNARFHASIFALLAAPAAIVVVDRARGVGLSAVALSVGVLVPVVLWNQARPIAGDGNVWTATRLEQRFRAFPQMLSPTESVVALARAMKPSRIGLQLSLPLYNIQRMMLDSIHPKPRLSEFNPTWGTRVNEFDELPDLVVARHAWYPRVHHRGTGTIFLPIAQFAGFSVFLPEAVARARGLDCASCPFVGWDDTEGLDEIEGPYTQWSLPVVRWGLGPRTRILFTAISPKVDLVMEARSNTNPQQSISVVINGRKDQRVVLDGPHDFQSLRIPLAVHLGSNELTLEYGESAPENGRRLAVLFRKLQILPAP